jgi:hypothetical protein
MAFLQHFFSKTAEKVNMGGVTYINKYMQFAFIQSGNLFIGGGNGYKNMEMIKQNLLINITLRLRFN